MGVPDFALSYQVKMSSTSIVSGAFGLVVMSQKKDNQSASIPDTSGFELRSCTFTAEQAVSRWACTSPQSMSGITEPGEVDICIEDLAAILGSDDGSLCQKDPFTETPAPVAETRGSTTRDFRGRECAAVSLRGTLS